MEEHIDPAVWFTDQEGPWEWKGCSAHFVTFALGTTLAEGQSSGGGAGEHMTSFDYAYKLEAVRDWLFQQSK